MSAIYAEVNRVTHWELARPMRPARAGGAGAAPAAVDMAVLHAFEEIQAEGEPDLIVELIDLYLEDAPFKLTSMLEAAAEADGGALRRAAHGLRGSSASLGARQVAALCEELERASRVDSVGHADALLDRLGQELEGARRAFEAERRRRA